VGKVLELLFGNGLIVYIYLIFGDILSVLYVVKEVG
jgi:hypothetical protein